MGDHAPLHLASSRRGGQAFDGSARLMRVGVAFGFLKGNANKKDSRASAERPSARIGLAHAQKHEAKQKQERRLPVAASPAPVPRCPFAPRGGLHPQAGAVVD